MTTSALLAVHALLALAGAGLWLGAGFVAAGAAHPPKVGERRSVFALALCGLAAVAGTAVVTALLADRGWWFVSEKAMLGLPLAVAGCIAGVVGLVRLRGGASTALERTLLLAAGFAVTAGAGATWLIGHPPQPVAALVLVTAVLLATGVAWTALARRSRRAVTGFAAMLVLLVVAGVGWSWLSDTAAPNIEAAAGHGHGAGPVAQATTTNGANGANGALPRSVETLRTPTDAPGEVRRFELTAGRHAVELSNGDSVEAWGFGGDSLPGPEVRVTEGEVVEASLANRDIEGGVTLHWHGYDVPNGEDGVAGVTQDAVAPGGGFTSRFVADDPGTYWYHTHQAGSEGVRRGLYGMLVVEPAAGLAEDLDLAVPVHTLGGAVFLGEVDGPQQIEAEPGTTVRLRVANTDRSPLRVLVAGAPFRVAAVDGRDVAGGAEVRAEAVRLGAGGRADLVFTMPDAQVRFETDASAASVLAFAPPGAATSAPQPATPSIGDAPELDLLAYGDGPPPDVGPFTAEGTLVLDRMPRFVGGAPNYAYTVNGQVFPHIEPLVVSEGDVVRITVVNRGFDVHPMHVHGHHVLVLSRDGAAATGAPLWLDTVDVRPGEVWELALRADNPGIWMDHCHDLEHAAQGMMMTLAYTGVTTPFEHGGPHANRPE